MSVVAGGWWGEFGSQGGIKREAIMLNDWNGFYVYFTSQVYTIEEIKMKLSSQLRESYNGHWQDNGFVSMIDFTLPLSADSLEAFSLVLRDIFPASKLIIFEY